MAASDADQSRHSTTSSDWQETTSQPEVLMFGGRPLRFPAEVADILPRLVDPREIFDIRRVATAPPPPPPSPDASYTRSTEAGQAGQPPKLDFGVLSTWPRRHVPRTCPDVVDIGRDGSKIFRPGISSNSLSPLGPDQARLQLFEHDPTSDVNGPDSGSVTDPPFTLGLPPAEGGKLLYRVNNTNLSRRDLLVSGQPRPFDVWDLQRLWQGDLAADGHRPLPLTVQTNIASSYVRLPWYWYKDDQKATIIHRSLILGPRDKFGFFECHTPVSAELYENVAVVTVDFEGLPVRFEMSRPYLGEMIRPPTPESTDEPDPSIAASADIEAGHDPRSPNRGDYLSGSQRFSPLKNHFLRILASPRAASSVQHTNSEDAVKLIILDLFCAVIECWAVFALELAQHTAASTKKIDTEGRLRNVRVWQKLRAAPRDIRLAIDHLFVSTRRDLPLAGREQLDRIKDEMDSKLQSINHCISDAMTLVSDLSTTHTAAGQEEQALSVKRLTMLAAIFLPLSLASSLLSMGSRAADLGVLWYDYIGVSVLLIFLAAVVLQSLRLWDGAVDWKRAAAKMTMGNFSVESISGPDKVMKFIENARFGLSMLSFLFALYGLKPTKGWKAYVMCHYALGLAVVASFVVGMFHDLGLGLAVMGYAAAGWASAVALLTGVRLGLAARRAHRRVVAELRIRRARKREE